VPICEAAGQVSAESCAAVQTVTPVRPAALDVLPLGRSIFSEATWLCWIV
jgi:hypothetical protein